MRCFKCGKEMDRENSKATIKGGDVAVELNLDPAYNNLQILAKYSDGKGESHVAICYECYIDGLFNIKECA